LNPATTRLEVWTEFIEAPAPIKTAVVLKREEDPLLRQLMIEPDLIDERLSFGALSIRGGQAFSLQQNDPFGQGNMQTGKSWERTVEGRLLLIEKVDYASIVPLLQNLPQAAALDLKRKAEVNLPKTGEKLLARKFPAPPDGPRRTWKSGQWASVTPSRPGLVLDYSTVNSSLTNYTFQADTTYLITTTVHCYGNTVLEGGAVIKFQAGSFYFDSPVSCQTSPWHPAVFTGKDDDSVGETISGSTGLPSGTYATYSIACTDTSQPYDLHDLRIRYGTYAFAIFGNTTVNTTRVQAGNVTRGVAFQSNTSLNHRNLLFYDVGTAFYKSGPPGTNRVEQATFHRVDNFVNLTSFEPLLTNCLLISVTNNVVYSGANVETNLDDTGIFQTVGSGEHYLAENSPYRDAGTTNIDSDLFVDLQSRTTYPPLLLTNDIIEDTMLTIQAPRDTNARDLGYHYDPLDYIARSIAVSNATLMLTNGTTVGIDFNGTNYAIHLNSGAKLISVGLADHLDRFVRIHAVQEMPAASGGYYAFFSDEDSVATQPQAQFRFTDFPLLSGSYLWFEDEASSTMSEWVHQDCQFRGGIIAWSSGVSNSLATWTNSLFERVKLTLFSSYPGDTYFWNDLFWNGTNNFYSAGGTNTIKDCLFVNTGIYQNTTVVGDYNGYVTNSYRYTPNGTNDVILTNTPTFISSALGNYYYPTNDGMLSTLIDRGSRYAAVAGLFNFTTTTDEVKEAVSPVDIGFHYVATTNNLPIDSDADGWADYLEDVNGDGNNEGGETSFSMLDTDNDEWSDLWEWLLGRDPVTAGDTNDVTGILDLRLFTPLK
jgi:hypothetical protein